VPRSSSAQEEQIDNEQEWNIEGKDKERIELQFKTNEQEESEKECERGRNDWDDARTWTTETP